jgi:hypothetical protein
MLFLDVEGFTISSSGKSLMSIRSRAGSTVASMLEPDVGNVKKALP